MSKKTIKAYKGFNADMTCRGFQFKEGETYTEEVAELCNKGFHACEDPIDCLSYYNPADNAVFHEVELSDVSSQREADTKICGKTIKVGSRVDLGAMIKASVEFLLKKGKEIASGDGSKAASSGDGSKAASSGDGCKAASSGNWSTAASSGNYSTAASSGDWSTAEVKGNECIAAAIGRHGAARASLGSWIVLTEIDNDGHVLDIKGAKVDGEKLKADTWYRLIDGQFVE